MEAIWFSDISELTSQQFDHLVKKRLCGRALIVAFSRLGHDDEPHLFHICCCASAHSSVSSTGANIFFRPEFFIPPCCDCVCQCSWDHCSESKPPLTLTRNWDSTVSQFLTVHTLVFSPLDGTKSGLQSAVATWKRTQSSFLGSRVTNKISTFLC